MSRLYNRINKQEGLELFKNGSLYDYVALACRMRDQKNPKSTVTYVVDSNPNYTNICVTDCSFCAFYRHPTDTDAYTLSLSQVFDLIQKLHDQGVTTILLQGGHNPDIDFSYYLEIIRYMRKNFPTITPHFFSASEIQFFAQNNSVSIDDILLQLKDAGQFTIPGGGAEVLSDRVRRKIAHKKGTPDDWSEVHRKAHGLGMKTTATMMYGHIETEEDILDHLDNIRNLQDTTNGFTAFIPWSFKPSNTSLGRHVLTSASCVDYLKMIAFSRVYLDNFDHIQASWFSEGKKTGQVALHFGADDFGGTIFEESVHKAANHIHTVSVEEIRLLIRESGFMPQQRTTLYQPI